MEYGDVIHRSIIFEHSFEWFNVHKIGIDSVLAMFVLIVFWNICFSNECFWEMKVDKVMFGFVLMEDKS